MSRVEAREAELAGVAGLRRQFEVWRADKGSGEAIPRKLWQAAATLARRHGANRIAVAVGLDSHKLKQISLGRWRGRKLRRTGATLALQGKPGVTEVGAGAQFIELKGPMGSSGPVDGEAVVELLAADGSRITLRLKDSSLALPGVIAALRGQS